MRRTRLCLPLLCALGACATPTAARPLLGADLDEVRARLGAPIACSHGGGTWLLTYRGADGAPIDEAVVVIDGVVVAVDPRARPNTATDPESRWLAASVDEVVRELGSGAVRSRGMGGTVAQFGDLELRFADGRVAAAAPIAGAAAGR
ncbi:MAG: hypothetical protein AB7O97_20380 [Planctomycetota bacterium]